METLAEVKQWWNDEHAENRNIFISPEDGVDSVYIILRAGVAEIMIHYSPARLWFFWFKSFTFGLYCFPPSTVSESIKKRDDFSQTFIIREHWAGGSIAGPSPITQQQWWRTLSMSRMMSANCPCEQREHPSRILWNLEGGSQRKRTVEGLFLWVTALLVLSPLVPFRRKKPVFLLLWLQFLPLVPSVLFLIEMKTFLLSTSGQMARHEIFRDPKHLS